MSMQKPSVPADFGLHTAVTVCGDDLRALADRIPCTISL